MGAAPPAPTIDGKLFCIVDSSAGILSAGIPWSTKSLINCTCWATAGSMPGMGEAMAAAPGNTPG